MLRVLIVEDSADLSYILRTELEWEGYRVDTAYDGCTGLAIAACSRPDVIVSDIKVPGMDGVDFVRSIRRMPGLSCVPAIALTGLQPWGDLLRVLTVEFNAYLVKPVEAASLIKLIVNLTQKRLRQAG
jgi:CheY-like chemotaxis protein